MEIMRKKQSDNIPPELNMGKRGRKKRNY